ncbi:MAG: NERD domain-containing protein [Oscillospiraceae bacterium]|nr:NERD domain-containing protein [Oscillospiraceae bacterium]
MRIYKNKNPYYKSFIIISAARITLIALPVLILIFYRWKIGGENYLAGFVFAALLTLIIFAYLLLSRHYRILLSGYRGEQKLFKIIKGINRNTDSFECSVFINLPLRYKNNRSEADMLIVGERGILLIEVKNHSGIITGEESHDFWFQHKRFSEKTKKKMLNPVFQLKRQRGIIKSLLRTHGVEAWVENVLFFSNPNVKLNIKLGKNNRAFSNKDELIKFINNLKPQTPLTREKCLKITDIIRRMSEQDT